MTSLNMVLIPVVLSFTVPIYRGISNNPLYKFSGVVANLIVFESMTLIK